MGGYSSEADISIKSGNVVFEHLDKDKFDVISHISISVIPPKPVAVPELAIVTPEGIAIVSPLVPSVSVVPVDGST